MTSMTLLDETGTPVGAFETTDLPCIGFPQHGHDCVYFTNHGPAITAGSLNGEVVAYKILGPDRLTELVRAEEYEVLNDPYDTLNMGLAA